jgi:hypothetical protein
MAEALASGFGDASSGPNNMCGTSQNVLQFAIGRPATDFARTGGSATARLCALRICHHCAELRPSMTQFTSANDLTIRRNLRVAGVETIDENEVEGGR